MIDRVRAVAGLVPVLVLVMACGAPSGGESEPPVAEPAGARSADPPPSDPTAGVAGPPTRTRTVPTPGSRRGATPTPGQPDRGTANSATTRRSAGPTRTPAPMRIDPVTAYGGEFASFRDEVTDKCAPKDGPSCATLVPYTVEGPDPDDKSECAVRTSEPDLHGGLTVSRDEAPISVRVLVRCLDPVAPETGAL